jgi:SAM-dependent methyltransferase
MTPKRAEEPEEETKRIAREIADTLAALATPLPSSGGLAASRNAGGPDEFALDGPRAMLENGARFVAPVLPADARARRAKALALRALRIVTRDQTVFNSAVLEALRVAFREIEQGVEATRRRAAGRVDAVEAQLDEGLRKTFSEVLVEADQRIAVLDQSIAQRLTEEASAREALGRESSAALKRVDRLEREADRRGADVDGVLAAAARLSEESARTDRRLADLERELRALRLEWTMVRSGLGPVARAAKDTAAISGGAVAVDPGDPLRAGQYVSFEETFRGSEEEIRHRQARDVERFRSVHGPVADLGCGRGEFLSALASAGIPGVGCDANPLMAEHARAKGLAVQRADLISWLAARPDGSLGGITAFQVVEHLPTEALFRLVDLAAAKLEPGGILLLETINPESVFAMKWFWMDLTHVRPVPGPSLAHLLEAAGFRDVVVDYRSPVPESDRIPEPAAGSEDLAPIARLLFAPQDIAVIGTK